MQCIRPLRAGYNNEFNTKTNTYGITFSQKQQNQELESFQLPCRKCLPCRLNLGREKAIRSYHESKMHSDNIFLTLTYDEKHLKSPQLIYKDFQVFMDSLRQNRVRDVFSKEERDKLRIPYMVTGEYGEKNKRPHWHAILFNYRPEDEKIKYTTKLGDKVHESKLITELWGKGNTEHGTVTMDSASYVARYAAKKLVHGNDQDHAYHPIHKTSSRRAIGKSWIEQNFRHTFENGFVVLPNGQTAKIPRYYIDWCRLNQPDLYLYYVTKVQPKIQKLAIDKTRKEEIEYFNSIATMRENQNYLEPQTRSQVELTILQSKFKKLQESLKL